MFKRVAGFVACGVIALTSTGCSVLQALKVDPATITQIQQIAVATCGFLPAVETVVGIVGGPIGTIPSAVANAICQAVAANQAPAGVQVSRVGAAAPSSAMVGNVVVKGVFVR